MVLFQKSQKIHAYINELRAAGQRVGFVPTMGALHQGHLELIRTSLKEADQTVCSIFVNPTQFNDATDLEKYPRTLEQDVAMLLKEGCDLVFHPTREDIYPEGTTGFPDVDLHGLDTHLEGAHRPGHFRGVVQVVHRLLGIIPADLLYMGQKDFQQFTIIERMLEQLKLHTRLRVHPIVREEDGLAMSSRNRRLSPEERRMAPQLYRALVHLNRHFGQKPLSDLKKEALEFLDDPLIQVEYLEVVETQWLQPIETAEESPTAVACVAARVGDIRLIDNMMMPSVV